MNYWVGMTGHAFEPLLMTLRMEVDFPVPRSLMSEGYLH